MILEDDKNYSESELERENFIQHLKRASEIVKTWPLWKQNVLGKYNILGPAHYEKQENSVAKPKMLTEVIKSAQKTKKKSYEFVPGYAVPPGATLKETLKTLNISRKELADKTGLTLKTINKIINGTEEITKTHSLLLERETKVPAHMWINLEKNYKTLVNLNKLNKKTWRTVVVRKGKSEKYRLQHDGDCKFWDIDICTCGLIHHLGWSNTSLWWLGEELGRHECQLEKIPRPTLYVKPTKEERKRRNEEAKKILKEVFRKQKLSDEDWLKESHESFMSNYIKEQT